MELTGALVSTAAAFLTLVVLEVARYLSFLKHRESGDVPSTQGMVIVGTIIAGFFELVSFVFIILLVIRHKR